jgi:RDD family
MAVYNPPQPLWKRNVAGILDFLFCFISFGYLLSLIFGNAPQTPVVLPSSAGLVTTHQLFGLSGWPTLILIGLTIVYFIVLGRSGGTIFQRLFRMRRAK